MILGINLGILSSSFLQSLACGWDEEPHYYTFFKSDPLYDEQSQHFSWSGALFSEAKGSDYIDNLEVWAKELGIEPKLSNQIYTFYFVQDSAEFISKLSSIQKGDKIEEVNTNAMAKSLWKKRDNKELFEYLRFSKEVESSLARSEYYYWDDEPADSTQWKEQYDFAILKSKESKSKALSYRYAFQAQKLAFRLDRFKEVIRLYDDVLSINKAKNNLQINALNNKFGALYYLYGRDENASKEKRAELILSLYEVFYTCPECAIISYENLAKFKTDDFFEADKRLNSKEDRCKLWYLSSFESVPLKYALRKILEIDPNDHHARIIMSRIIMKWEEKVAILEGDNSVRDKEFADVLQRQTINSKVELQSYWALQLAYYNYLCGDFTPSLENLTNARRLKGANREIIAANIQTLDLLLKINDWTTADFGSAKMANEFNQAAQDPNQDLKTLALGKIAQLGASSQKNRAYYLLSTTFGGVNLSDIKILKEVRERQPTTLMELLWNDYQARSENIDKLEAEWYFNHRMFAEAMKVYQKLGFDYDLNADPRITHINDCHECDHRHDGTLEIKSRLDLCKKILGLQKQVNMNVNEAKAAEVLGNIFYNITYFGNNRWLTYSNAVIVDTVNNAYLHLPNGPRFKYEPDFTFDMTWAEFYYKKALAASIDMEFKAKMQFMLAKCEQNRFYYNEIYSKPDNSYPYYYYFGDINWENLSKSYRKNFKKLNEEYSSTQFYKEVLKECSYFENYVKTQKKR